jgi:predicted nuclease of restriction endonuclease-like RecB superfamily
MYKKIYKSSHKHRWFIDANTGEEVCLCGAIKGSEKKENKYHNKTQTYNGHHYDSTFEAEYAQSLDYSLKVRNIKKWERQVKLDLRVNGEHITNYYIDFIVTHNDGVREFVEVKGYETPLWKMKWRILEATFDQFKEDPDDFMTMIKQKSWGPPKRRIF